MVSLTVELNLAKVRARVRLPYFAPSFMTIADYIAVVDLAILVLIWWDGRVMKKATVRSVELQSQGVEHQKSYLDLRRRWYEQRSKRKEAVKDDKVPSAPGDNPNS